MNRAWVHAGEIAPCPFRKAIWHVPRCWYDLALLLLLFFFNPHSGVLSMPKDKNFTLIKNIYTHTYPRLCSKHPESLLPLVPLPLSCLGPVSPVAITRCVGTCLAAVVYSPPTLFTHTGQLVLPYYPCLALLCQCSVLLLARSWGCFIHHSPNSLCTPVCPCNPCYLVYGSGWVIYPCYG